MSQHLDLKQAERKVFRSAFDDGLWEVLIGCVVLMFPVALSLTDLGLGDFWSSMVFVPLWVLAYLVVRVVRRRIVVPRIGVVKLGQSHRRRLVRFNLVTIIVLLVGLFLGLVSAGNLDQLLLFVARHVFPGLGVASEWNMDAQGWIYAARFGLTVLVAFGAAAFFLEFRRLYVYGVLLAVSPLIGEWLYRHAGVPHHGFQVTFGATGALILLVGLVTFARLMRETAIRKETLPTQEVLNGHSTG
jgi:hypothetical protein